MEHVAEEFVSLQSRHWKPRTHKRNLHAIKRQIQPVRGSLPVKDIARSDIARWRDGLAARPGLFNCALPVLSSMCKLAETLKLRPKNSNPCRNVK
ncbi:phage integrase central domain-containing protein [Novosphingobium sp. MMS21-SN21R]|uniref:phage integrase central domain-containing protein n=1 Tax=Novosphingobium sp. MMS21-SN21R TaxID=2969298 RepID=UPI003904749C